MTGYISGDSGNATYRLISLRGNERKKKKRNHLVGEVRDERWGMCEISIPLYVMYHSMFMRTPYKKRNGIHRSMTWSEKSMWWTIPSIMRRKINITVWKRENRKIEHSQVKKRSENQTYICLWQEGKPLSHIYIYIYQRKGKNPSYIFIYICRGRNWNFNFNQTKLISFFSWIEKGKERQATKVPRVLFPLH